MFWTVLALVLMVLLGGFISYYGDLQGRRWGKKRVSLFGMRPKYTAILLTSLTGAFIVLFSIGTVLAIFPAVRDVALRGEEAIRENKRLKEEYKKQADKLNLDIKDLTRKKDYTLVDNNDLKQRNEHLRAENEQANKQNRAIEAQNRMLAAHNTTLQREQRQLEATRLRLETNIHTAEKEIANAEFINKEVGKQNTQLVRDNTEMERRNKELAKSIEALEDKNQKLLASNMDLLQKGEALKQANGALQQAYERLLKANEEETTKREQAANDLREEILTLKKRRDELALQLEGTSNNFVQTYLELRQARFTLRADAELARRTLDAHMRPEAVRAELTLLLHDASEKARRYGAAAGENGLAVSIVNKRLITPARIQKLDEAASLAAIVDNIAASNTPVVVVAQVVNNSVAGEQALVELSSYAVGTVFKKGETVATRQIEGRQPVDKVVQGIVEFLQRDVRNAALRAGTIPHVSPETGMEEVGTMGTADLIALTERVRKAGGKVQLTAVADAPVTAADSLTFAVLPGDRSKNLRFEIKRLADRPLR